MTCCQLRKRYTCSSWTSRAMRQGFYVGLSKFSRMAGHAMSSSRSLVSTQALRRVFWKGTDITYVVSARPFSVQSLFLPTRQLTDRHGNPLTFLQRVMWIVQESV